METSNIERLVEVFDRERDPYMEWHDGPELYQVDAAVGVLSEVERPEARSIVASRLKKGYDPYLGRAAELLGGAECLEAVTEALAATGNACTATAIAKNLLVMGRPEEAVSLLKKIIENQDLGWSLRIEALVQLKIALDDPSSVGSVRDYITPGLEASIFGAVTDEDYLVRYHAAETILRLSGDESELSGHDELFRLVCGKSPIDSKPDSADRDGFRKAAEMLMQVLKKRL